MNLITQIRTEQTRPAYSWFVVTTIYTFYIYVFLNYASSITLQEIQIKMKISKLYE